MNLILVKMFATALALAQVTAHPDQLKTQFDPAKDQPEVVQLLKDGCAHMIALAVSSSTLEMKKKYQAVPVLRNLVPSQVLLGNSSFNTGNSISAGLPSYVRNRIKAIADILDRG